MTWTMRCASAEVSGTPASFCTDTVLPSPWLFTTMRNFSGDSLGLERPKLKSLLSRPGSLRSVVGVT